MDQELDDVLRIVPSSAALSGLIWECDRLKEQGNIPGMREKLAEKYDEVRSALNRVAEVTRLAEELERQRREFHARQGRTSSIDRLTPLYVQFYRTWRGTRAIGAPCGFPYSTENELMRLHDEISRLERDRTAGGIEKNKRRYSNAKETVCWFQGQEVTLETEKAAYIWMLERFIEFRPNLFELPIFARIVRARKRRYFAKNPADLYANNSKLAQNKNNYVRLTNNWYADANLSENRKREKLFELADLVGLTYGLDWRWDVHP